MRIVSFSLYVPYEGVPHAGGEYYLRHIRALLQAGHEVVVVAPDYPENREGLSRNVLGIDIILVSGVGLKILAIADRFNDRFRVAKPQERLLRNTGRDHRVERVVRQAELLEFQWTQSAAIYTRLPRGWRAGALTVAVAHDVLTEKFTREAADPRLSIWRRPLAQAKLSLVRFDERRSLRFMDVVLTFSEKDVSHLQALLGDEQTIRCINPPLGLGDDAPAVLRTPDPATVLMVGAFYRRENADGAKWFLDEVWPVVREAIPNARLDLVGGQPSPEMISAASRDDSVTVTGYVDDLSPYYKKATVAVVPLHAGAGVKFKTITAMLWGIPVISTSIGAEGVLLHAETDSYFLAIEDDAIGFSQGVIRGLEDQVEAERTAIRARHRAETHYGLKTFAAALNAVYTIPRSAGRQTSDSPPR